MDLPSHALLLISVSFDPEVGPRVTGGRYLYFLFNETSGTSGWWRKKTFDWGGIVVDGGEGGPRGEGGEPNS